MREDAMKRKTLREVLEAEQVVSIRVLHAGTHTRSEVTDPVSRVAMPVNTMRRLAMRGTTLTFGRGS